MIQSRPSRQIRGLVDIYLPDIKYMENRPGKRFSAVDDYADIVPGVLREMLDQTGNLEMNDDGIAVRGLLVRHLVLPGHTGEQQAMSRLFWQTCLLIFTSASCLSILLNIRHVLIRR